jgi:hypothetical protein
LTFFGNGAGPESWRKPKHSRYAFHRLWRTRNENEAESLSLSFAISSFAINGRLGDGPDSARADRANPDPKPNQHRAALGAAEPPEKYRRRR